VNLERFPVETPFVLSTNTNTSLEGCCNLCRTTQGETDTQPWLIKG